MARQKIGLAINQTLHHFRSILRGIQQYAAARPQWIVLHVPAAPEQLESLRASRPDGLIAQVHQSALIRAVQRFHRPAINVSRIVDGVPFPHVGVDEAAIGELAARHLLDRGFSRFAFIGHLQHDYSGARMARFQQLLNAAGHQLYTYNVAPEMLTVSTSRPWTTDRGIRKWLVRLPKPVAIFAANDKSAAQLTEVCRLAGVRIPEEVALIGVDNDTFLCELARPSLSSVELPGERVGFEAAALLDRLMQGKSPPRRPILLPPVGVVARQSSDLLMIDDPDVSAALRFIHSHSHMPLQVDDVARAVPAARRSLEKRFRSALKKTIADEIRRAHLERARQLLTSTDLSMADIAEHAGFSDGAKLCTAFRKALGCTPTEYRRQFRGDRSTVVRAAPHHGPKSGRS